VNREPVPMNPANFMKMAHGDADGLRALAMDYFNDTRRLMTHWVSLLDAENFAQLRDELHRCTGGASLFGLERIVALIGACESPTALEERGFDFPSFEKELSDAESAICAMAD